MFGNLGGMGQMKEKMEAVKEKLAEMTVEAGAGNGQVNVVMSGSMQVKDVEIADELMSTDSKEELQDLLVLAINRATQQATELSQKEMKGAADSIFPGLSGMLS